MEANVASAEGAVKTLDAFQFDAQPGLDANAI